MSLFEGDSAPVSDGPSSDYDFSIKEVGLPYAPPGAVHIRPRTREDASSSSSSQSSQSDCHISRRHNQRTTTIVTTILLLLRRRRIYQQQPGATESVARSY